MSVVKILVLQIMCLVLCSVEEVCDALLAAGWCEGTNVTDLEDPTFCRDPLCPDTLVFSQPLRAPLQHSGLAAAHMLNTQVEVGV